MSSTQESKKTGYVVALIDCEKPNKTPLGACLYWPDADAWPDKEEGVNIGYAIITALKSQEATVEFTDILRSAQDLMDDYEKAEAETWRLDDIGKLDIGELEAVYRGLAETRFEVCKKWAAIVQKQVSTLSMTGGSLEGCDITVLPTSENARRGYIDEDTVMENQAAASSAESADKPQSDGTAAPL